MKQIDKLFEEQLKETQDRISGIYKEIENKKGQKDALFHLGCEIGDNIMRSIWEFNDD